MAEESIGHDFVYCLAETKPRIFSGLESFIISEEAMNFRRILFGFMAGFFATLVFHQGAVYGLWQIHIAPFGAFNMHPTRPFGVPAVLSLAFWGGIWGILFALIHRAFPAGMGYWLASFLFGAIAPSLVALMVVMPIKGMPMGGDWHPPLLITAFLVNGAWGIGTALILRLLGDR